MKNNDTPGGGESWAASTDAAEPERTLVPKSDPAAIVVAEIVRVVPASRWAFAHVGIDGEVERLLVSDDVRDERARLRNEIERQRGASASGPRIAAILGPLGAYESGITLLFADARATFGILTLLRTPSLGPFTSAELSVLAFAVATASEHLALLRFHANDAAAADVARAAERVPAPAVDEATYILDRELAITLAWHGEEQLRRGLTGLQTRVADRLPKLLEETVRELTASWGPDADSTSPGTARPVPFLVVRTQPMSGAGGLFIGVRIERFRSAHSLAGAAARYHITPRELQVLGLLLDGTQLDEIGRRLHITSSTVQDHVRNMVEKTGSRNRSSLIARILGWEATPEPEQRPGPAPSPSVGG